MVKKIDISSAPVLFKSKVGKYFGLRDLYTKKGSVTHYQGDQTV